MSLLAACLTASATHGNAAVAPESVSASAVFSAEQLGETLIPERSTEFSRTWLQPNGDLRVETFAIPINYKDTSGAWVPIDNTLVDSARPGIAVENESNSLQVRLPEDAGAKDVRVVADGNWVSFRMRGLDGRPVADGPTAVYDDVSAADEVRYSMVGTALKEEIVLAEPPSSDVSFTFDVSASAGQVAILTEDGAIEFTDVAGHTTFSVPAPVMFDSAPDSAYSDRVAYQLEPNGSESWVLTVRPDTSWLQDEGRVYPVIVDPTVTDGEVVRDCWLNQNEPTASHCGTGSAVLKVGSTAGKERVKNSV